MELRHNPESQRYSLLIDDQEAYISYKDVNGLRVLNYSFVPPELRGRKIGAELVHQTYEQLIEDDIAAKATCRYLVVMAKRKPEWQRFLG